MYIPGLLLILPLPTYLPSILAEQEVNLWDGIGIVVHQTGKNGKRLKVTYSTS